MKILFVCSGNICRSPTAEGVFRRLLAEHGLEGEIEVDSAGTGRWHVGQVPDERATEAAARRGIALQGTAREAVFEDFYIYDLIVAMDRDNARDLMALAGDSEAAEKVVLLREFDPGSRDADDLDVPDPYYGGPGGFDRVLDLVQTACEGLLEKVAGERRQA